MTMAKADNPAWTIGTTQATLETEQIQPGQSKEYKVTMQWQNAETTVGTKLNTAEIIKTTNPAGFEETSLEDNKTAAELIIAINVNIIRSWSGDLQEEKLEEQTSPDAGNSPVQDRKEWSDAGNSPG